MFRLNPETECISQEMHAKNMYHVIVGTVYAQNMYYVICAVAPNRVLTHPVPEMHTMWLFVRWKPQLKSHSTYSEHEFRQKSHDTFLAGISRICTKFPESVETKRTNKCEFALLKNMYYVSLTVHQHPAADSYLKMPGYHVKHKI